MKFKKNLQKNKKKYSFTFARTLLYNLESHKNICVTFSEDRQGGERDTRSRPKNTFRQRAGTS